MEKIADPRIADFLKYQEVGQDDGNGREHFSGQDEEQDVAPSRVVARKAIRSQGAQHNHERG